MSDLTKEEATKLDRLASRASRAGLAAGLVGYALIVAAVWEGDWRFAVTGLLAFLPAAAAAAFAAYARSPECARRIAAARRQEDS